MEGLAFLLLVCAVTPADYPMEDGLGTVKGEPIDTGFFFWKGEYVEAPYVVESRGLVILINGHEVTRVPMPTQDWRTYEDPGPPPAGCMPWDKPPDKSLSYWNRKWYYLNTVHGYESARDEMFKLFSSLPELTSVQWEDESRQKAVLVDKASISRTVYLSRSHPSLPPLTGKAPFTLGSVTAVRTTDVLLKEVAEDRQSREKDLRLGSALFINTPQAPSWTSMGSGRAVPVLEILCSGKSPEEKVAALKEAKVLRQHTEAYVAIKFSDQLAPRVAQAKRKLEEDRLTLEATPHVSHVVPIQKRETPATGNTNPESQKPATPWEAARDQAIEYIQSHDPERQQILALVQKVLDLSPPRGVALHLRVLTGHGVEKGSLPLYESIVRDYADLSNHYDLMTAKVYLGDIYYVEKVKDGVAKAEKLYREVLSVPPNDVIFDDPYYSRYNPDEIARAKSGPGNRFQFNADGTCSFTPPTEEMHKEYRQMLYDTRNGYINGVRGNAIRSLARARIDLDAPETILPRLNALRDEYRDDEFYRKVIDDTIRFYSPKKEGLK